MTISVIYGTHHIPPHTTSYTFSTYRRLLMRSEVLKVELLTLQTYFMTIDIWKKITNFKE